MLPDVLGLQLDGITSDYAARAARRGARGLTPSAAVASAGAGRRPVPANRRGPPREGLTAARDRHTLASPAIRPRTRERTEAQTPRAQPCSGEAEGIAMMTARLPVCDPSWSG